jgi:hypothetical protein
MCVPSGFPEEPFDERAEVPPEQSHQLTHHLHSWKQFGLITKKLCAGCTLRYIFNT